MASARDKLRKFFKKNVGVVVNTHQLRKVGGISEYARRIRELRDEEGMQILSHIDRHDLKPGQYLLETLNCVPRGTAREISPQTRSDVLERDGYTCKLCGCGVGDKDPCDPSRSVRLHIDHIVPVNQGGSNEPSNLRVLCSACNQTRSNITTPSENALNILARIRRQPRSVQQEVYEALRRAFDSPGARKNISRGK